MSTKSLVPAPKDNFLKLKCADCIHFKGVANPHYSDRCSKIGVQSFAKACKYFTPDLSKIRRDDHSTEALAAIANAIKNLNESQLRIMAFLLVKQGLLRKLGLRIGQPLYIYLPPYLGMPRERRLSLEKFDLDYLDQWYKGYIIGAIDVGENAVELYISPTKGDKPDPYTITLQVTDKLPSYVLTWRDFKVKKAKLEQTDRKKLPKETRNKVSKILEAPFKQRPFLDDVQTIDNVPQVWLDSRPSMRDVIGLPGLKIEKRGKGKVHKLEEERKKVEQRSKNSKLTRDKKGRMIIND